MFQNREMTGAPPPGRGPINRPPPINTAVTRPHFGQVQGSAGAPTTGLSPYGAPSTTDSITPATANTGSTPGHGQYRFRFPEIPVGQTSPFITDTGIPVPMTSPFRPQNFDMARDSALKPTPIAFVAGARNTPIATGADIYTKYDHDTATRPFVQSTADMGSETPSPPDPANKATTVIKVDPSLRKMKPPVLQEKAHPDNFRRQVMDPRIGLIELIQGARAKLKQLNPEYWPFSFASRVVCIKSDYVENVGLAYIRGEWVIEDRVAERLMQLWNAREASSDNIYFLVSVNGAKSYCGLAEMVGAWKAGGNFEGLKGLKNGDGSKKWGTVPIIWHYCKNVSYEWFSGIRHKHNNQPISNMWNGMHYPYEEGRKVVEIYAQSPNLTNILCWDGSMPYNPYKNAQAAWELDPRLKRGNALTQRAGNARAIAWRPGNEEQAQVDKKQAMQGDNWRPMQKRIGPTHHDDPTPKAHGRMHASTPPHPLDGTNSPTPRGGGMVKAVIDETGNLTPFDPKASPLPAMYKPKGNAHMPPHGPYAMARGGHHQQQPFRPANGFMNEQRGGHRGGLFPTRGGGSLRGRGPARHQLRTSQSFNDASSFRPGDGHTPGTMQPSFDCIEDDPFWTPSHKLTIKAPQPNSTATLQRAVSVPDFVPQSFEQGFYAQPNLNQPRGIDPISPFDPNNGWGTPVTPFDERPHAKPIGYPHGDNFCPPGIPIAPTHRGPQAGLNPLHSPLPEGAWPTPYGQRRGGDAAGAGPYFRGKGYAFGSEVCPTTSQFDAMAMAQQMDTMRQHIEQQQNAINDLLSFASAKLPAQTPGRAPGTMGEGKLKADNDHRNNLIAQQLNLQRQIDEAFLGLQTAEDLRVQRDLYVSLVEKKKHLDNRVAVFDWCMGGGKLEDYPFDDVPNTGNAQGDFPDWRSTTTAQRLNISPVRNSDGDVLDSVSMMDSPNTKQKRAEANRRNRLANYGTPKDYYQKDRERKQEDGMNDLLSKTSIATAMKGYNGSQDDDAFTDLAPSTEDEFDTDIEAYYRSISPSPSHISGVSNDSSEGKPSGAGGVPLTPGS